MRKAGVHASRVGGSPGSHDDGVLVVECLRKVPEERKTWDLGSWDWGGWNRGIGRTGDEVVLLMMFGSLKAIRP